MDKLKNIFFEEEENEEIVEEAKKEKSEKEVVIKKVDIPKSSRVEEYKVSEEEIKTPKEKNQKNVEIVKESKTQELIFDDEDFITEDVCWNAIAAAGYKVRWFNEVIYLCEYLEDGLTKNGANERTGHIKNFRGYAYYVKQSLKIKPEVLSITDFREFNRTCSDLKMSFSERAKAIDISLVSYVVMFALKMPVLYAIRMIRRKKGLL